MTRPKNMNAAEAASWRARKNQSEKDRRDADPSYKAKVFAKSAARLKTRRAADPAWREHERAYRQGYAQNDAVKRSNAQRMKARYEGDPVFAEKQRQYWERKRNEPAYKVVRLAKQRDYGRKYKAEKRLNEEFEAFMARIELEEVNDVEQSK